MIGPTTPQPRKLGRPVRALDRSSHRRLTAGHLNRQRCPSHCPNPPKGFCGILWKWCRKRLSVPLWEAESRHRSPTGSGRGFRFRKTPPPFDQGTITVHDGKGGKHRVVPLPMALENRIKGYLVAAREKHLQDLAVGAGEVHMAEALARKYPNAPKEWYWQYIFASATLCPHPRTGRVARHHLHEASMQRQFKIAVSKAPSRSLLRLFACATHSRHICSIAAPTSAPFRTSWATPASKQP